MLEEVIAQEEVLSAQDGTAAPIIPKPLEVTEVSDEVVDEVLEAELTPEVTS